jgi:cell division protein FtsL
VAARTERIKYASRAAVYGSNAYDLARVGDLPLRAPVPEERPSPKPARAPEARPAPRQVRKTQRCYGISLFAVAGFVVVAALMVFVVLANVRYTEISAETVELQTRLAELTEEERKLKIEYEDIFDVNEVEAYATNVLGMTKPSQDQIATVSAGNQAKAVIVDGSGDNVSGKENMASFLASLVAYFKQTP